jgi:hypothetical protein
MKRVPTPLELAGLVALAILGLYLLYEGITEQSASALIGGAACFALGAASMLLAVKNSISNRQVFRHAVGRDISRNSNSQ